MSTHPFTHITASLSAPSPGELRVSPQIKRRLILETLGQRIVQAISAELSAVRRRRWTLDHVASCPIRFVRRNLTANRRWTPPGRKHFRQGSATDTVVRQRLQDRKTKSHDVRATVQTHSLGNGRGFERWNESGTCWNGKKKVSGIEKSPPWPEISRNCGRSSIASNERIMSSHPLRPTSLQRRCQDSSGIRSGPCMTTLQQQTNRPSPDGDLQMNRLHQSPYRQGHSTETALLKISDILDAVDSAQVTLPGLLDLSADFDTVDHDILLTRLQKSYDVGGTALAWISSSMGHQRGAKKFKWALGWIEGKSPTEGAKRRELRAKPDTG